MAFTLAPKEETQGTIAGCDYGVAVRLLVRAPDKVLFTGLGANIWRRDDNSHHALTKLFWDRPTKAQFAKVKDQIDAAFGAGIGDAAIEAWSKHKTVIVDGGGEPMPPTTDAIIQRKRAAYDAVAPDYEADLTGRIKTCCQCGANLKPHTARHSFGYREVPNHPRNRDDCRRMSNHEVVRVHGYDLNRERLFGFVSYFETWDGESLVDEHFCNDKCAALYGRRAVVERAPLAPGIAPVQKPHEPTEIISHDVREEHHFDHPELGRIRL